MRPESSGPRSGRRPRTNRRRTTPQIVITAKNQQSSSHHFPTIRTALVAGALLAFALSFDEIAVTFFLAGADTTTLPLWVLGSLRQTQSLPEVNAVAAVILLISLPLIAISAYLMRDEGAAGRVVQGE